MDAYRTQIVFHLLLSRVTETTAGCSNQQLFRTKSLDVTAHELAYGRGPQSPLVQMTLWIESYETNHVTRLSTDDSSTVS